MLKNWLFCKFKEGSTDQTLFNFTIMHTCSLYSLTQLSFDCKKIRKSKILLWIAIMNLETLEEKKSLCHNHLNHLPCKENKRGKNLWVKSL